MNKGRRKVERNLIFHATKRGKVEWLDGLEISFGSHLHCALQTVVI